MDNKYLLTKETAEEMKDWLKDWLKEPISKYGETVGMIFNDFGFLETINKGLDNGINMIPLLQVDGYKQIFSTIHAGTYIQAVKDGNEDIAKNVSAVLKEDDGHLKPLFSWEYLRLVDDLRYNGTGYFESLRNNLRPDDMFDVLLSTDETGHPAYTINHIRELHSIVEETQNTNIGALLKKGNNGKCLYNEIQMNYLAAAVKEGFRIEPLTKIRENIENNNHDTLYDSLDMFKVTKMMEAKFHKMMNQKRSMEELLKMDDKYWVTKETAEKMRKAMNEFISEFEKENGHPCYEDDFLKIINEGLDNEINMSPFFRLENYDYQLFSPIYAKMYIEAVKDGKEDIAKNVSTALEKVRDSGETYWEPLFYEPYLIRVNEIREMAKTLGEPDKFDVLLFTDEEGYPAYETDAAYEARNIWELYYFVKDTMEHGEER